MKRLVTLLLLLPCFVFSQNMNNEKLETIYTSVSDSIQGHTGAWQFYIKGIPILSITDENHNRMRIMSPIANSNSLSDEHLKASLVANFHTVLDVKYAVSDGVLWSVFIHPLKELSNNQVEDAVSQVYFANVNFGTTFTSTSLIFPGKITDKKDVQVDEKPNFKKL